MLQRHLKLAWELEPVFNAMLENAARFCNAKFGVLYLFEGDGIPRCRAAWRTAMRLSKQRRREPVHSPHLWNCARTCGRDQADGSNRRCAN